MEAQEIFDTVATHLLRQGRRSMFEDSPSVCAYRGAGGTKCAVGVLIPDELYNPEMEMRTIYGLVENPTKRQACSLPDWMEDNLELLANLQSVHDRASSWKSSYTMKSGLKEIAEEFSLKADVLEGLSFAWETKVEEV